MSVRERLYISAAPCAMRMWCGTHYHHHHRRPCSSWVSQAAFVPHFTMSSVFLMEEELGEFIQTLTPAQLVYWENIPCIHQAARPCHLAARSGWAGLSVPRSAGQRLSGDPRPAASNALLAPLKLPDLAMPRWPGLLGATARPPTQPPRPQPGLKPAGSLGFRAQRSPSALPLRPNLCSLGGGIEARSLGRHEHCRLTAQESPLILALLRGRSGRTAQLRRSSPDREGNPVSPTRCRQWGGA